jgi:hypothetical protein
VDFSPTAGGWETQGHHGTWNLRTLMAPKEVGVRIFGAETNEFAVTLEGVVAHIRRETAVPTIRHVRVAASRVPRYGLFEVAFDLPDRYPDPFDSDEVLATLEVTPPGGKPVAVDAFYGQDYYREVDAAGEDAYPQGPPHWRARFTPVVEGEHEYRLRVRDRLGTAEWGPARFTVTPSDRRGFVRVARCDPRFFEFDNGEPFFPIGHNVRSPFDERHDRNFPWLRRFPEGSAAYLRYFREMEKHGETLAEIWSAAWSLGLEWSPKWPGYHGIGQFNLRNAWELDLTLAEAERRGIYLNLVVHNHGKFGSKNDKEWEFNPFNIQNGGYLVLPDEYFTDPRALRAFRKLMRYMIARWGYSPHILAWELWSELNLTGSSDDFYRRPEVVDWHRLMGRYIERTDPNRHLVSTHYSGDYNTQNTEIVILPEMGLAPVDAYHRQRDPLYIVEMIAATAQYNNRFGKPVLITEFGGSSMAQDVWHLRDTLHAALWSSTCIPVGATPLFWWWHVVEEENFYPMFAAVSRFMKDVDRRGPDFLPFFAASAPPPGDPGAPLLLNDPAGPPGRLAVRCMKNRERAIGWIYHVTQFECLDPAGDPTTTDLALQLGDWLLGEYEVEFWNTETGEPVLRETRRLPAGGRFSLPVPAFSRDIAFKVRRMGAPAAR